MVMIVIPVRYRLRLKQRLAIVAYAEATEGRLVKSGNLASATGGQRHRSGGSALGNGSHCRRKLNSYQTNYWSLRTLMHGWTLQRRRNSGKRSTDGNPGNDQPGCARRTEKRSWLEMPIRAACGDGCARSCAKCSRCSMSSTAPRDAEFASVIRVCRPGCINSRLGVLVARRDASLLEVGQSVIRGA